ncbi:MAG: hypothetical protein WAU70_04875 [Flavobacteriales bacterium]
MEDFGRLYHAVEAKLHANGFEALASEFLNAGKGAVFGSDGMVRDLLFLMDLRANKPHVYKVIEKEAQNYIDHCAGLGISLRA